MKLRVVPEKQGDRVLGVRLYGIKAGSAASMLGLENGDRLETVAGIDVTSPEKMLEVYGRLKTGNLDRMTLHLTRNGAPLNLDFVIR
jgi:general secretion pathway protein C